jgi:hypothetical protein
MVIITGDSWGVAEWRIQDYKKGIKSSVHGPGIAQWLQLCVDVTNLSRGAGSNKRSLYKLEKFLERYKSLPQDRFIWIVTGPERCAASHEEFVASSDSIYQALKTGLNNSLDRANDIAKKHNIIIEAVGGICDLLDVDKEYSNLKIAVPSWGRLLSKKYAASMVDPSFISNIGPIIKKSYPEKLNEWLELAELAENKNKSWGSMRLTFFKTDGAHPDRDGHFVLLTNLFPNLAEYYELKNENTTQPN